MDDFADIFAALKPVFGKYAKRLTVKTDTAGEYALQTKTPSPLPRHKGQPMFFGSVVTGKGCVSLHLMPIYMNEPLTKSLSEELKRRKRGKACFNFKKKPDAAAVAELKRVIEAGFKSWEEKNWV